MGRSAPTRRKRQTAAASRESVAGPRLVALASLAGALLPYLVISTLSNDAPRESKLLALALAAAVGAVGLALATSRSERPREDARGFTAGRIALLLLGTTLGLALLSGLAAAGRWAEPATAVAVLAPLTLLLCGSSAAGEAVAPRLWQGLMAVAAFTGALAFAQRFAAFPRVDLDSPQPRFLATALIGNPGDIGAALVLPGLLLWMAATKPGLSIFRRALLFAGLAAILLGLGATEAVGPLLALGAGVLLHALFDWRRRLVPVAAAAALLLVAAFATGIGQRAVRKLRELEAGQLAAATTQRDIGVLAALEMVRAHPVLGVGPGCFENAFVPARIAAESRARRRMVHLSESAHFENAHSEPLTLAAEIGLPGALAALLFAAALISGLVRRADEPASLDPSRALAVLLMGVGVLSLGSFPLRLAVTSGPAAFAAGLALRRLDASPMELVIGKPLARRLGWLLLAAFLAALGLSRWLALSSQASGEDALRDAVKVTGDERNAMLSLARGPLARSVALRPRRAQAWLALGSVDRLSGRHDEAWSDMRRAFAVEERAEIVLNLGRMAQLDGRLDEARALYRRAIWILPRLLPTVPPELDPKGLEREIEEIERALADGGKPPTLPAGYESPL